MEKKSYQRIVLETPDSTWVCEERESKSRNYYQSERDLEEELIKILQLQGYEYCPSIKSEQELKNNLRRQLEKLNSQRIPGFKFTDEEWKRFYGDEFEGYKNIGVANRTKKIQKGDCVFELIRDDGTACNITIFNKKHPQNNYLQVINQFSDKDRKNRYDVTILVNGLPLVQIELKKRGQGLKEAFRQAKFYVKNSFSDLFEFVQIFIVSNGTSTKYYSNTTHSFKFTSFWSYVDNTIVRDLVHFAKTFLQKRTILEILAKYCVLDSRGVLKILRPYQIAAIEGIICQIVRSINMKSLKPFECGGYIWHTTGSGKTLTSFKAAQLAMQIPEVKKVLFVVDRKDLDSQTYAEYKNFLGDVEDKTIDNTDNTEKLKELINDVSQPRIIVTTIQKLRRLLNEKNSISPEVLDSRIVIIADECHRSQTKELHGQYINKFKNRNLFGFTGTPLRKHHEEDKILDETKEIFGECLHEYKIVDAIKDDNVLRFWIDYVLDVKNIDDISLDHPKRIKGIAEYIIGKFNKKTFNKTFNSMMAVDSVPSAIKYYKEFKRQQNSLPDERRLKIAMIFHNAPKFQEGDENKQMDDDDRKKALEEAIEDYNKMFNLNIDKNSFNKYREDVSDRTKKKEIDILLVVDMFLTGFDAPILNTIWIDKNLKEHGLIQAFSRTNRIFSKQKQHGNIICFRNLKKDVDDALLLFAALSTDIIEIPDYKSRIIQYKTLVQYLREHFPLNKEWEGEAKEKDFINKFGEVMNLRAGLLCSDEFENDDPFLTEEIQDYRSRYIDFMNKYRESRKSNEKDDFRDDVSFEPELMRVDEVDVDYIHNLLGDYYQAKKEKFYKTDSKQMRKEIMRWVNSSMKFSKEKFIISDYLDFVDSGGDLEYQDYKNKKFYKEIDDMIEEEELNKEGTRKRIDAFVEAKKIKFMGDQIQRDIMPRISNLISNPKNTEIYFDKWNRVKDRIEEILDKFNFLEYW